MNIKKLKNKILNDELPHLSKDDIYTKYHKILLNNNDIESEMFLYDEVIASQELGTNFCIGQYSIEMSSNMEF